MGSAVEPPNESQPPPVPPSAAEPAAPKSFADGRYVVRGELGRGGMGRVFAAHDTRLQRDVAIKVLNDPFRELHLRRFALEQRAACLLSHPNVVAVHDAGEQDGEPYLVTELLRGISLRTRLMQGPLSLPEVLDHAVQLARGLAAIHEANIVHRDLKPENLFLLKNGLLKVLDFGIAKLMPSASGRGSGFVSTDASTTVGTTEYMAPEQLLQQSLDARTDIFAFGVVLYEMLSGRRPFTGATRYLIYHSIVRLEPPPLPPEVPAELAALVTACLQKDAAARPSSMREVLAGLVPEREAVATPVLVHRAPKLARRAALAGTLALALLSAWALWRSSSPAAEPSPRIAILPFSVGGSGQYQYLREGLVALLSGDLASGAVRVVDPNATIRRAVAYNDAPLDTRRAAELAASLDADRYTLGTVIVLERQIRIQVRVYERSGPPEAQFLAQAAGDTEAISEVIDDVSRQLDSYLSRAEGARRAFAGRSDHQARRPPSSKALRAYMEGEAALRQWDWVVAARRFEEALEIDPGYALAAYHLAVVVNMESPQRADVAMSRAMRNIAQLSVRERSLLRAFADFRRGDREAAVTGYREHLKKYPDDVEALYQLGEVHFHLNPLHGLPAEESAEPFQQALVLDPWHGGALRHLIDLAQMKDEKVRVLALANRYLEMAPTEAPAIPIRWTRAWAQGDLATREMLKAQLAADPKLRTQILTSLERAIWQHDDLEDAHELALLLSKQGTAVERAEGYQRLATVELARGHRRASQEALRAADALHPEGPHRFLSLFFQTFDWLPEGAAELEQARLQAGRLPGSDAFAASGRAYVLGMLAVRAGDLEAGEKAAREVEGLSSFEEVSLPRDYSLAIRARIAAVRDQPRVALDLLRQQRLSVPYRYSNSFLHLSEQALRGELFSRLGDSVEAIRWYSVSNYYAQFEAFFSTLTMLRSAEILERTGQATKAAQRYRLFIERWRTCDEDLAIVRTRAAARLRHLQLHPGKDAASP